MKKDDMAKKACRLWVEENKKYQKDKDKDKKDINHDVMGSYSGVSQDPCETPEQDADDL